MRLTDSKVLIIERNTASQYLQECIVFTSLNFPGVEFHAVWRYYRVIQEIAREELFGITGKEVHDGNHRRICKIHLGWWRTLGGGGFYEVQMVSIFGQKGVFI